MIVISVGMSIPFCLQVRGSSNNLFEMFILGLDKVLIPASPCHSNLPGLVKTIAHRTQGQNISTPETDGFPWKTSICVVLLSCSCLSENDISSFLTLFISLFISATPTLTHSDINFKNTKKIING